jgi:hypothetical protein
MIIYHSLSFYQTLTCIVHSLSQKDVPKILLFTTSIKPYVNTKILEELFDQVIYIKIREGLEDLEQYEENVCLYYDSLFQKNNIIITPQTRIYAAGSHYNFGVYLVLKEIPFFYIEEACGLLSKYEHVKKIDKNNRSEVDIIDLHGLYDASNSCIEGIICNTEEQELGYQNEKMVHFDVLREMTELCHADICKIISVFGDEQEIAISQNSVIFLSQHYANLNMMSYDQQAYLYGLIFDYFMENKEILIKRHPADVMAYGEIYPKIKVIKERFLSEFIPFIMHPKPQMIATISSTGIKSLKSSVDTNLAFDFAFEEHFEGVHRLYCALRFCRKLESTCQIKYLGVNTKLIENMQKYTDEDFSTMNIEEMQPEEIYENSILIVDQITNTFLQDMDIEEVATYFQTENLAKGIIFLNTNSDFLFYKSGHTVMQNCLFPFVIKKMNLNPKRNYELYDDFESEHIYLYSAVREVMLMAENYEYTKDLENLQMQIKVKKHKTDTHLKIAVLEGIIEATQKRLLHYIEKCDIQEAEILTLKNKAN